MFKCTIFVVRRKNQTHVLTHVVVECRGKKEDNELELAFLRYCKGENWKKTPMPFEIIFADKKTNAVGLQLADLVARPIGLNHIRPTQNNRVFDILKEKFFCRDGRNTAGNYYDRYGLKVYPNKNIEPQKAKNPDECTKIITPTRNAQST
jgi:hypothetical protein